MKTTKAKKTEEVKSVKNVVNEQKDLTQELRQENKIAIVNVDDDCKSCQTTRNKINRTIDKNVNRVVLVERELTRLDRLVRVLKTYNDESIIYFVRNYVKD